MCVVSMIHDHFDPIIPTIDPEPWKRSDSDPWRNDPSTIPAFDLRELDDIIKEFRRLLDMAKTIDIKTNQPDCVDPEKAKLQDRIVELEKLIAQPPQFVIVSGGKIEPGRYRVIEGKLYKEIE